MAVRQTSSCADPGRDRLCEEIVDRLGRCEHAPCADLDGPQASDLDLAAMGASAAWTRGQRRGVLCRPGRCDTEREGDRKPREPGSSLGVLSITFSCISRSADSFAFGCFRVRSVFVPCQFRVVRAVPRHRSVQQRRELDV
jgi:hypothetical protein